MPGAVTNHSTAVENSHFEILDLALSTDPFAERVREVMRIMKRLVSAETVNLGTIDFESRQGAYYALNGFLMPPERRALLPQFLDEHPMLRVARTLRVQPPLRFADFYSRREFEDQPIYRECYRGFTHSMLTFNVPSPTGVNVSFVMSRSSGEFTEAERDRVASVQPTISLFMENALLRAALDMGSRGAIGILMGSGSQIQHINLEAERIFRHYFPGQPLNVVPPGLSALVQAGGSTPQTISRGSQHALTARLRGSFTAWTIGLAELPAAQNHHRLTKAGLTGREIDILQWLEQGKANADIGIILGISPRTVEKHLENIYAKLGVESRHAAARQYRELTED